MRNITAKPAKRNVAKRATTKPAASVNVAPVLATEQHADANAENDIPTPDATDENTIAAMRGEMLPGADTVPDTTDLATPPAPAAEASAPSDTSADKATRRAADRAAISAVYRGFDAGRVSIPVKPLSAFKPVAAQPHPNGRNPSERQISAFIAAAASSGVHFVAGAVVPRRFDFIDPKTGAAVPSCIENGCVSDALRSGIVTVADNDPGAETFTITAAGARYAVTNVGEKRMRAYGVLPAA